jgi:hypothetical protein
MAIAEAKPDRMPIVADMQVAIERSAGLVVRIAATGEGQI